MRLVIERTVITDKSTVGQLFIDDRFFCHTLEDTDRMIEAGGEKIYGETAIPRGIYSLVRDFSPKYGRYMPHILNVPQFSGVRIHSGNKPEDSEGCILVGKFSPSRNNWISESLNTFNALDKILIKALANSDEIILEVV